MNRDELDKILVEFGTIPNAIKDILDRKEECFDIAKTLYKSKDIFYIGRGIDYALCMEGSLKIKEIAYIHSEAYPAGELKHGSISLIEDKTNVVGIVSKELLSSKTLSNIEEVIARGAVITLVITDDLEDNFSFPCQKFVVKKVNDIIQPLLIVVPLQLIAFEVARIKGCDIDKPRNLAKSVTVE